MKYHYFHPLRPQYFFPQDFQKHKLFLSFFQPYSFYGAISWFLFVKFSFFRFFLKKNIDKYLPYDTILDTIGHPSLIAFNIGTVGPERKITGLGIHNESEFFIKFGTTKLAIANIINEYNILKLLSAYDYSPKILDFKNKKSHVLLKTNTFSGRRLKNLKVNSLILVNLIQLAKLELLASKKSNHSLKFTFAHGDYCPWNIIINDKNILLFDWEMGGHYPLGYDLFTFIFQTNFLLNPDMKIDYILSANKKFICEFFNFFNVKDWSDYLIAFAEIKISIEKNKKSFLLHKNYCQLLIHAKKT